MDFSRQSIRPHLKWNSVYLVIVTYTENSKIKNISYFFHKKPSWWLRNKYKPTVYVAYFEIWNIQADEDTRCYKLPDDQIPINWPAPDNTLQPVSTGLNLNRSNPF